MNSRSNSLKIHPPSIIKKTCITRANTISYKTLKIEHDQTKKFHSTSQTNFISTENPWIVRSDFKSISVTDMNHQPSEENLDSTKKSSSNHILLTSEDEDDRELFSNTKTFVDQASQVIYGELKIKQKKKTTEHQLKKLRTSPRRPKPINVVPPLTQSSEAIVLPKKVTIEEPAPVKRLITVDTSKARSNLEVVRSCIRELGWKECSSNTTIDSDIYWHSASFHEGNPNFAFNSGRVNKFPGMTEVLRKVHLTRLLNNMRLLFPHDYNFYPKTWFLPEQSQQFKDDVRYIHHVDKKHNRSLTTFIVKPSDGSQGEGIYLLRDPSHITNTSRPHVIQEYIDRPLLINGLKFDLRIYVLILNLNPLEIFLYDEGLVRFATIDYKAPTSENLRQTYMHLTNYSLNKRSVNYKHTTDEKQTDGSKRKLSLVWKQLSEMFGNDKIERTKHLIVELINKTILAVVPQLRVEYEFELPAGKKPNLSCFQIVGFDVILTEHLRPILLEVNSNPSLRIDFDKESEAGKLVYQSSLIDEEIKKPLILETLKLALPRKKLNTIARHARILADDEISAQHYEKIAQRRIEERIAKLQDMRKSRFDMRLNPFLSRPLDSIAKEFGRQQQTSSSSSSLIQRSANEPITPYTQFHPHPNQKKSKHVRYETEEDNENALPTSVDRGKRSCLKSTLTRPISMMADAAAAVRTVENLKLIYPASHRHKYERLVLIDQISSIYIQLVVMFGYKTMTGSQFRSFANACGIINETITAPSIDILYFQILRKWQTFVVRTTLTGLPFAAFIEAFFLLSQRKYPNASNLLDSVTQLLNICQRHLNLPNEYPTASSSSSLSQQHHRLVKPISHSSALNNRPNQSPLRSSTTTSLHRSALAVASAPSMNHPASSPRKPKEDKLSRQSAKSVFPLFFNVL